MEIIVSKAYLGYLVLLWAAPVISAVWGFPIWVTVMFMCIFAIYAGHEWVHAWICRKNNLKIEAIFLCHGGDTSINFEEPEEGPNKNKIISDVYLSGIAWDGVFYAIAIINMVLYAYLQKDQIPYYFAMAAIITFIITLAMPG